MKIIHCSDLHLDADLRTKYDAASAAERRAELLDTFRRLCRYAREEAVSAVLICGDLFDTASPSSSAVRTVEDLIIANRRCSGPGGGRKICACSAMTGQPGNFLKTGIRGAAYA